MARKQNPNNPVFTKFDIFVGTLGWLWSLHGMFFVIFCTVGVLVVPRLIYKSLNNEPRHVDVHSIFELGNDDVVRFEGVINPDELIEFKSKLLQNLFTYSVLQETDRKVVVCFDRILSDEQKAKPGKQYFVGTLHLPNSSGDVRIKNNRFNVIDRFRDKGVDMHDEVAVIEAGVIPEFNLGLVAYFGLLLAGFLYVLFKLKTALYYMNRPKAFMRLMSEEATSDEQDDD